MGRKPFCNILLYSKALIYISQWTSSLSTSSWKGYPHHDTSSSMLNCCRDAFTIVFLTRSSNTPLWRSACNWNIDSSLHITLLNHSESNFPYSGKSVILSDVWDSNGFLTHLPDTKPTLDNLLVIALLERVLFSELLNSADSFCRLLFLSLRTVNFSRWSSLHDEALGLPDLFFLVTLPVVSKRWPILLKENRDFLCLDGLVNFWIATVGLTKTSNEVFDSNACMIFSFFWSRFSYFTYQCLKNRFFFFNRFVPSRTQYFNVSVLAFHPQQNWLEQN